jgi:hypothetical protein
MSDFRSACEADVVMVLRKAPVRFQIQVAGAPDADSPVPAEIKLDAAGRRVELRQPPVLGL